METRRKGWAALVVLGVLAAVLTLASTGTFAQPPMLPSTFYGVVGEGNGFVPQEGMAVEAYVGEVLCGESTVEVYEGETVYVVMVQANAVEGRYVGCGRVGDGVVVYVDGWKMAPEMVWTVGGVKEVDVMPSGDVQPPGQYCYEPMCWERNGRVWCDWFCWTLGTTPHPDVPEWAYGGCRTTCVGGGEEWCDTACMWRTVDGGQPGEAMVNVSPLIWLPVVVKGR